MHASFPHSWVSFQSPLGLKLEAQAAGLVCWYEETPLGNHLSPSSSSANCSGNPVTCTWCLFALAFSRTRLFDQNFIPFCHLSIAFLLWYWSSCWSDSLFSLPWIWHNLRKHIIYPWSLSSCHKGSDPGDRGEGWDTRAPTSRTDVRVNIVGGLVSCWGEFFERKSTFNTLRDFCLYFSLLVLSRFFVYFFLSYCLLLKWYISRHKYSLADCDVIFSVFKLLIRVHLTLKSSKFTWFGY